MANVSTLVSNIRKLLDMNNSSQPLIATGDIDALSLDEVIEGTLVNAARYIEGNAPAWLLDPESLKDGISAYGLRDEELEEMPMPVLVKAQAIGNGYYKGVVKLEGEKLIRLVSFQLKGWERPGTIITEEDPRYALQTSPWGLKGTPEDPVAAIVLTEDGPVIEGYSIEESTVELKKCLYIPEREINSGEITISEKLQSAIEYYAAYLTCLTYGNGELATYMLQQALTLAQIPTPQTNKQ